jgi:hypothetical protein
MENNFVTDNSNGDFLETLIEIKLAKPDDFLKIKETLTRIGIASRKEKKLFQSCHILHKQGKYYIVHFKELFILDQKGSDFSEEDRGRRNTIANLLAEWKLVELVNPKKSEDPVVFLNQVKILSFKEKGDWSLEAKYTIGSKHK